MGRVILRDKGLLRKQNTLVKVTPYSEVMSEIFLDN